MMCPSRLRWLARALVHDFARTIAFAVVSLTIAIAMGFAVTPSARAASGPTLRIGSKRFTESYILAEIVAELARKDGLTVSHERGLGGTAVTYRALEDGAIDLYPEYTGTLDETVAKTGTAEIAKLREALAAHDIVVSDSLGFENTYALATSRAAAARFGLAKVSDLSAHRDLKFGVSHEFAGRSDGWPGLSTRYGLPADPGSALDHALAYEALKRGTIDVTDVYTTDAKIARYDLQVLEDDKDFFPPYEAVLVHRRDAMTRFPALAHLVEGLRGRIDADTMRKLNARVELDGVTPERVASDFVAGVPVVRGPPASRSLVGGLAASIARHGPRHLELVVGSLLFAALLGVPLGIFAFRQKRFGALVLGTTGVVQTIPSLALFCFMIPLLGIGPVPALAALSLYGLLPIVRNTHAGLSSIPSELREAAVALGLSPAERLVHVELPLASRTILAGVKTSAVVAVGSATIAAFIGAGGFGEPISTGLALNDVPTILEGALPAAGLALVVQGAFALLERALIPAGLR